MRSNYIFWIAIFFLAIFARKNSFAQEAELNIADLYVQEADVTYKFGAKRLACDQYKLALDEDSNHVKANYMAAVSHLLTIEKYEALKYLLRVQRINPNYISDVPLGSNTIYPDLTFLIGYSYHLSHEFDDAIRYYQEFEQMVKDGKGSVVVKKQIGEVLRNIKRKIYECEIGKELVKEPVSVDLEPIVVLNTESPDFGPALTSDEGTIVWTTRSRDPEDLEAKVDKDLLFFEDILISKRKGDGGWSDPQRIREICTKGHESVVGLSADGKTLLMYFEDEDLYFSEIDPKTGKFGKPKKFGTTINTPFKESSAAISPSGKFLFFSSNMPGGFGGFDLYVSENLGKGKWAPPINLGAKVNSEFDEEGPVLSHDGKTLYFGSRGHKGMGGYDIFYSVYNNENGEWSDPVNLGYPINTSDDDLYYVPTKDSGRAYYSSAKEIGTGDLDLYQVKPGKPNNYLASLNERIKANTEANQDVSLGEVEKPDSLTIKEEITEVEQPKVTETEEPKVVNNDPVIDQKNEDETSKQQEEPVNNLVAKNDDKEQLEVVKNTPKNEEVVNENPVVEQPQEEVVEEVPEVIAPSPIVETKQNTGVTEQMDIVDNTNIDTKKSDPVNEVVEPVKLLPVGLIVKVIDFETNSALEANVTVKSVKSNKEYYSNQQVGGTYSYTFSNEKPLTVNLYVEKEGYVFKNMNVSIPSMSSTDQVIERNIVLKRIEQSVGNKIVLRNIYFDFNKSVIKQQSYDELEKVVLFLKDNPKVRIEVSGHTDSKGSDEYNLKLSQLRANSVADVLRRMGISASRLVAKGYGEARPLASNDDEREGRELNRRIEFEILK